MWEKTRVQWLGTRMDSRSETQLGHRTAAKWENKSDQSLVRGLVVSKEGLKEIPSEHALDLQLACPTGKQ